MSTYDAYNLSLRDSTEFTVPTGGSGGDNTYELVDVTFVNNSTNAITFTCSMLLNDPQYESFSGFAKNILTRGGLNSEKSITVNMLIPTGGATICMYELLNGGTPLTTNATGDIRTVDSQNIIIVYGSGTVTFSDIDAGDNPK